MDEILVTGHLINSLMEQSHQVRKAIQNAQDPEDLERAAQLIKFAAILWESAGYGYKSREMQRHLKARAAELIASEEEYLAGCRKNDRNRRRAEHDIDRLRQLCTAEQDESRGSPATEAGPDGPLGRVRDEIPISREG